MRKKLGTLLFTSIFTLCATANIFAATLTDSVGSDSNDVTIGSDTTQGKITEYSEISVDDTTYENSSVVNMYATKASKVQYSIPKTIIGDAKTKTASYKVGVKGDIDSYQTITIEAPESFELTDGKRTVTATITQEKTSWDYTEITNNEFNEAVGTINFDIPAGSFTGSFNFLIRVNKVD